MIVLGIDPGMATTGWGIIQKTPAQSYQVIGHGCFLTTARQPMLHRLQGIASQLRDLIAAHRPSVAAVEELFFAKNSRTAANVGQARGVILFVLGEMKIPVFEYNPRKVKIALTGYGGADKTQMQGMVQRLLRLRELPKPDDAADALAIALCHMNTISLESKSPGVRESRGALSGRP